jgi:uncharacterized membrane protein YidH (DUF202 family)
VAEVADTGDEGTARDPGLARERTELAWNRSGLAVAVAVAIIVRRLWPLTSDRAVLVLLLIAAGAALWAVAMRFGRGARDRSPGGGALGESACRMLTAGTLLLAGGALAVSFL